MDAALTATLTDPDGVTTIEWVWERSSNRSTWTEIDDETSDSYTPVTGDISNYLRVRVTYTDGHGEPDSKSFQRDGHQPGDGMSRATTTTTIPGTHHDP